MENILKGILEGKNYIGILNYDSYVFTGKNNDIYVDGKPICNSGLKIFDLLNMNFYETNINCSIRKCCLNEIYENNGCSFIAIYDGFCYNVYFDDNNNLILDFNGEKFNFDDTYDIKNIVEFKFFRLKNN